MLKITAPSVLVSPVYPTANENSLGMDSNGGISGDTIDDKLAMSKPQRSEFNLGSEIKSKS